MEPIRVIGAGLAGSEAAYQIARAGIPVILHEMKPQKYIMINKLISIANIKFVCLVIR